MPIARFLAAFAAQAASAFLLKTASSIDDVLWLAFSSKRTYAVDPGEMPQIWVAAIQPSLAEKDEDPSSSPFWLPGQEVNSDNHLPVWWAQ